MSERHELAVLIPLEDPRGDAVEHLRTWTHGQKLERDRYQVILGSNGESPEVEHRVAELLTSHDEVVRAPGASLVGLYDAAARAARAPVLVFSEAHCQADPGCLRAVAQAFASDPELDAAIFDYRQTASSSVGELSTRWLETVFDQFAQAGWTRLEVAGSAIRRETFEQAGGLNPRLETFAGPLLSAQLQGQGARISHLSDAVVSHENQEGMRETINLARSYARGECLVRSERDPEFCERYFGPAGLWGRRLLYQPENSRSVVAALISAIRESPRDAPWLSRELATRVPASVAGSGPRRAWERATASIHQVIAGSSLMPPSVRWRSFGSAQMRTIRSVQLREGSGENAPAAPPPAGFGVHRAGQLDGLLIGCHGLESDGSRAFRWTEPVAVLRLAAPEQGAQLRIETGGLRGDPREYVHGIYAGGHRLPSKMLAGDEQVLEACLSPDFVRFASGSGLVLICRPLVPSRFQSADSRRLGMPIVEFGLSAL